MHPFNPPNRHVRVFVARVKRSFPANGQLEVEVYQVAATERFGPWSRRKWVPMAQGDLQSSRKEVVEAAEVLCKVELENEALTTPSLERLAALGVPVGSQPGRDASIAPRVA